MLSVDTRGSGDMLLQEILAQSQVTCSIEDCEGWWLPDGCMLSVDARGGVVVAGSRALNLLNFLGRSVIVEIVKW